MTPERNASGEGVVLAERYRLETQVAAGGMGEVWRATDLLLQRTVAVKLLRESLAEDPIVAERFRREALTAANISHPNMADVFDYVQEDGRPGIVMEFVDGETLAERIAREAPLDVAVAVRIASAVLAVLEVAHDTGIVHRDVKPGNVMLTPTGHVKVTDFGIARAAGHETLTETGMVVGTAHYLAPEQVMGKQATPTSDLYAVGAILYEMLTAAKPFEAETSLAVAMRRLAEQPRAPREHRPELPESVELVVLRALARDPEERYPSAGAMRAALAAGAALVGPTVPARRADPTPTEVLRVVDPDATVVRAAVTPPPASVGERRRRDYRRGLIWAAGTAVGIALVFMFVMALAGGTDMVEVPRFVGKDLVAARSEAAQLGLKIQTVPRASAEPEGQVLGQSIDAGTQVGAGAVVRLDVSTGVPPCCPVPALDGLTEKEAKAALERVGLRLGDVSERVVENIDAGRVVDQSVDSGEVVPEGSAVDIVVAKRPDRKGKGRGNND